MAYDLRSQIYNLTDCIASANAPIDRVAAGLTNFTTVFDIAPSKLVLGGNDFFLLNFKSRCSTTSHLVPWYCYDYECLSIDENNTCVKYDSFFEKL